MSVKRAFAQVQNTFLSIGPLQNSLHLEQTILCDQNKREGRVDPALQFGARTIREATLPRQGADLIRLSCNGLAGVGDRRERGRRWYVSIVSALDCRGRCAATSLNYSRGKDGARRRPPSAILNCEDRAKTKGNEDGEIRDFRVPSGSRKKKESKLLVKITRSTCTSNGMNISWRSNSKIRPVSWKGVYPRITVSSWSSFGEFHGVVGCVRLKARSVRGGAGGTRLHAIGIVVATLYVSPSTVTPKPGHYAFIRANYTRYITLQRRLFPVSSYYARAPFSATVFLHCFRSRSHRGMVSPAME